MARDAGGVRRASATVHHAEPVSRRSGDPGGGERQYPSQTERDGVAPATGLRQLLAGVCAMAATAAGGVLGGEVVGGGEARNGALGKSAAVVGGQSLDRSGQRVSGTPAVWRSCWRQTLRWRKKIDSIAAWIALWSTSPPCFSICGSDGRTCSRRSLMCCFMT